MSLHITSRTSNADIVKAFTKNGVVDTLAVRQAKEARDSYNETAVSQAAVAALDPNASSGFKGGSLLDKPASVAALEMALSAMDKAAFAARMKAGKAAKAAERKAAAVAANCERYFRMVRGEV